LPGTSFTLVAQACAAYVGRWLLCPTLKEEALVVMMRLPKWLILKEEAQFLSRCAGVGLRISLPPISHRL